MYTTTIYKNLKSTFNRALNEIQNDQEFNSYPLITLKAFATCVATLCHDNVTLSKEAREDYLVKFMGLTGGPTIREHYCMWMAFGRGDAIQNLDKDTKLVNFNIDERFKRPGTWKYYEAYSFAKTHVFTPIGAKHKVISEVESYFDDPPEDIQELQKL
jgi:hypothetical protein